MADVYCVTRTPTLFGNNLGQLKDARRHAPVSQPLVMRLVVGSVAVEVVLAESPRSGYAMSGLSGSGGAHTKPR
jgi:hypothetical protein